MWNRDRNAGERFHLVCPCLDVSGWEITGFGLVFDTDLLLSGPLSNRIEGVHAGLQLQDKPDWRIVPGVFANLKGSHLLIKKGAT